MTFRALVLCLVCTGLGEANVIPQAEHRNVKVGDNVTLSCALTEPKDVLQVTWQKDAEKSHNNIATYSTMKGLRIHEPYQDRMNFTSLVLNETSITFWDTRMDDSGCYTCLFNAFPFGSFSARTCLTVSGFNANPVGFALTDNGKTAITAYDSLLIVVMDCLICVLEGLNASVHYNISEGHLIAICNAVGLPEPTITWNNLFNSTPTVVTVRHTNGVVSVTSKLEIYNTQSIGVQNLTCRVSNADKKMELPVKMRGEEGSSLLWLVITVGILIVIVLILIMLCWRKRLCRRT